MRTNLAVVFTTVNSRIKVHLTGLKGSSKAVDFAMWLVGQVSQEGFQTITIATILVMLMVMVN